jgi:hypothetical protein
MNFEWDDTKNDINIAKHGIDFWDAKTVFADPHRIERQDVRKDYGEIRMQTIGTIGKDRYLLVVYTMRKKTCRIISARQANTEEKEIYNDNY